MTGISNRSVLNQNVSGEWKRDGLVAEEDLERWSQGSEGLLRDTKTYWGVSDASGDEDRLLTRINLGSHLYFDIDQLCGIGQVLNFSDPHL